MARSVLLMLDVSWDANCSSCVLPGYHVNDKNAGGGDMKRTAQGGDLIVWNDSLSDS